MPVASARHEALSIARGTRSSMEVWGGASMNRFPCRPISSCARSAQNIRLSGPARRMCPSHFKRLILNLRTRFRLVVVALASCWIELFVILANIELFAPFRRLIVLGHRSHVSHPYVSMEHTAASYSRNFRWREMHLESNMLLRRPHLVIAIAILLLTSSVWSAFAGKIEPRYVNWYTFSSSACSHITIGRCFCCSTSFCFFTSSSASLPLKTWGFSTFILCVLEVWMWIPLSDAHDRSHCGQRWGHVWTYEPVSIS